MKNRGIFITIEGVDGIGKTTQTKLLYNALLQNIAIKQTREPGGTHLAEKIRHFILNDNVAEDGEKLCPVSELLLFNTARYQHMENFILPNINNGTSIICDRFIDSTLAYQSKHCGEQLIIDLHNLLFQNFYPDITIVLYMDQLDDIKTRRTSRLNQNRYDKLDDDVYLSMNQYFLSLHSLFPHRHFIYLNANDTVTKIHNKAMDQVTKHLRSLDLSDNIVSEE